jgi:hypothetical protein
MASTSPKCDYLGSNTAIPYAFASERAELVHVNEQIRLLDGHISQLNALRRALRRRSRQLHNALLPIHTLPIEVLSQIFQHIIDSEDDHDSKYSKYYEYRECLRLAFVLSSVSTYFRDVALCSPELWKRIPLNIINGEAIGKVSSLLQYCMALAPCVSVSISDALEREEACSAAETLFTSDMTRKIKAVELTSPERLDLWITKLKGSSFPMLDTLDIFCEDVSLDLRTLNTVTQLRIHELYSDYPITMPPYVRYLDLVSVRPKAIVSILYQCPNLEECFAFEHLFSGDDFAEFNEPLTLGHLKRLTLCFVTVTATSSSAQNLRLPILEYLRFEVSNATEFSGVFLLCRNVSDTLTTLKIQLSGNVQPEYCDDLYRLCRIPFPMLRKLGLRFVGSTIRALTLWAGECGNAEPVYFPSLTALTLDCLDNEMEPRCFLGLLDKWRAGNVSYFHVKVKGHRLCLRDWSQELREELRSVVGGRQIGVTWGGSKVL